MIMAFPQSPRGWPIRGLGERHVTSRRPMSCGDFVTWFSVVKLPPYIILVWLSAGYIILPFIRFSVLILAFNPNRFDSLDKF